MKSMGATGRRTRPGAPGCLLEQLRASRTGLGVPRPVAPRHFSYTVRVPTSPDPLLALIRRVRTRCLVADAGSMFVMAGFVVAIAFLVASLTLRLVPMSIDSVTALIVMAAVLITAVLISVLRRWPNDARVARRIDAALELRELLASGLASTGDDAPARSVRAAALEKARLIRASEVPTRMPSPSAFAAAALMLTGVITVNALLNGSSSEVDDSARLPTRPNRTPAGLMDHDAARRSAAMASPQQAETEATRTSPAIEPPTTAASRSTPVDGGVGRTEDGDGRERGRSEWQSRANIDLQFSASDRAKDDATSTDARSGASGSAPAVTDSTAPAPPMRAGASPPRNSDRGRSGSQRSDSQNATVDDASQSRRVAHIPDRHRDLVRAYFDANTTQPSDAAR